MIIPDTNILLYAHIPSFREHSAAKNWLEETLNEDREKIGLAWQVITSYIRGSDSNGTENNDLCLNHHPILNVLTASW